jgi:hypothetical protein
MLFGALLATTLALPSSSASASAKALTCPTSAAVTTAIGASFGAPKYGSSFAGSGYCTYKATTGGKTLVVAYSKLGKAKFKNAAKTEAGKHDKIASVKGVGKAAIRGTGALDVLFVQSGNSIYEVLDNTKQATLPQLSATARLVLPS